MINFEQLLKNYIGKGVIKAKMEELQESNNGFKDLVFNVPTNAERDFIKYETLKELLDENEKND